MTPASVDPRPRRFRKPYHSVEVTRGPRTKAVTDRQREEVERFLRTGESDPLYLVWPGDVFERSRSAEGEMRAALIDDVHKRAWDLANLYLASVGASLLSAEAPGLVGLSEETTCYVSIAYFRELGRFEDFIVHEAAHIFHNCKRHTMGLPESSAREWPLDIAYDKRETFAYSCEAFSRIVELGGTRQARLALVRELADGHVPETDRFDAQEYVSILTEAAGARNGWKHILSRCAPLRHRRRPPGPL